MKCLSVTTIPFSTLLNKKCTKLQPYRYCFFKCQLKSVLSENYLLVFDYNKFITIILQYCFVIIGKVLKIIFYNTNESAQSCELHNKDVLSNWVHLIGMNMYKANYICTMQYCCPQSLENISQSNIFNNQLLKYVETDNCCVAILNAFPIFIADYIGLNKTRILYGL